MASYSRGQRIVVIGIVTTVIAIIAEHMLSLDRQSIPENPELVGPTYDPEAVLILLGVLAATSVGIYLIQRLPPLFYWYTVDEE